MTDIYFVVLVNEDVFTKVCTLKRSNSAVAGLGHILSYALVLFCYQDYSTCVNTSQDMLEKCCYIFQ